MSQFPYMPFYTGDFFSDTQHLSFEERAAYNFLLYRMWEHKARLPDNDTVLARLIGITLRRWRTYKPMVMPFLTRVEGGFLTQKKLLKEYRKCESKSQKNSESAYIMHSKKRAAKTNVYNGMAHANAYANAPANAVRHALTQEPDKNITSTSQFLPDDPPVADAPGADPTGPPSIPVSDKLLNTKLVKKGN